MDKTDRITLSRLAVLACHGMNPEDDTLGQHLYISVTACLDLAPAGRADNYAWSVCYARMADLVHGIAMGERFTLMEGLADAVAGRLLVEFPRIEAVTVRVDKPAASLPYALDEVSIEIERKRRYG